VFFQTAPENVSAKLGELTMTTKAQTCANRRNALKSTGPRTRQSKAATAQNAAKLVFFSHQPEKTDYKLQTTKKELRKNNLFFQNKPNLAKKSNERKLF
jgi:hypothetical protein